MTLTVTASKRSEPSSLPVVVAVLVCVLAPYSALAAAPPDPSVRLYDTGRPLVGDLDPRIFLGRRGWKEVSEGAGAHPFTGSAVALNDRCAVVFREASRGAEVFAAGAEGYHSRAFVGPWSAEAPSGPVRLKIVENGPTAVEVESAWTAAGGERLPCRLRLAAGEAIVRMRPGDGVRDLLVASSSRHVVTPEFLGDDAVFVTGMLRSTPVGLPAENVVLGLLDGGRSMLVCLWEPGAGSADLVTLGVTKMYGKAGEPESLRLVEEPFAVCRIGCVPGKAVWVSCLEGPDLWQTCGMTEDGGRGGAWGAFKPPFPAKWRASFVGAGGVCESITFEQPPQEAPVPEDWRGPVIIYPIDRSRETPLTTILPMDILRSTLGVGPCQYILEAEGLGGDDPAPPDAVVGWIERLVEKKRAARSAEEINERLDAMLNHLAAARARIDDYAAFGKQVRHVCREAAKQDAEKETVEATAAVLAVCDRLDHDLARGRKEMRTRDEAANLAREIAALVEKPDALAAFERPATALRAIGHAFDATLARSRMAARRMKACCRGGKSDVAKTVETMADQRLRPSK